MICLYKHITISRNKYVTVTYNDYCNISNQHPMFEGFGHINLPIALALFFGQSHRRRQTVPKSLWEHRDVELGGHRLLLIR